MLENVRGKACFLPHPISPPCLQWCWEAEVLARLSNHYKRSGEKLPVDTVTRLVKAKNLNAGLLNLRQIFFATYDLTVHSSNGT